MSFPVAGPQQTADAHGIGWKALHTAWILVVVLGAMFFSCVGFIWVAARTRYRSWVLSAGIYTVLTVVVWVAAVMSPTGDDQPTTASSVIAVLGVLVLWPIEIVHAIVISGRYRRWVAARQLAARQHKPPQRPYGGRDVPLPQPPNGAPARWQQPGMAGPQQWAPPRRHHSHQEPIAEGRRGEPAQPPVFRDRFPVPGAPETWAGPSRVDASQPSAVPTTGRPDAEATRADRVARTEQSASIADTAERSTDESAPTASSEAPLRGAHVTSLRNLFLDENGMLTVREGLRGSGSAHEKSSQVSHVPPATQPTATVNTSSDDRTGLGHQVTASPVFEAQREQIRRRSLTDEQVAAFITFAQSAPRGQVRKGDAAEAMGIARNRSTGAVTQLQELLNVEAYPVLSLSRDRQMLELDLSLLRTQFEVSDE